MTNAGTGRATPRYQLDRLDPEECERHLAWLLGESSGSRPVAAADQYRWALAHCDAGVTWGRYDSGAGRWLLGRDMAQEVSPSIGRKSLQELRIFGERREVFIWRAGTGLRGRVVRETEPETDRRDQSNPLRPSDECRIFRGSSVRPVDQHGAQLTHLSDGAGAQQVVPVIVTSEDFGAKGSPRRPLSLHVRHYYEEDPETGAVRIAVTRLVDVVKSGQQGGQ